MAVDLLEGILGTDGQALKPWTLTVSIGGRSYWTTRNAAIDFFEPAVNSMM